MKITCIATFALSCIIAAGCARQETPSESVVMPEDHPSELGTGKPAPIPAATIAPVNVRISLSPAAKERIATSGAGISVDATYAGDPKESAMSQAGSSGMIDLGKNSQILPGEGAVIFEEDVIDPARLALTEGEVQLTINVTSSKTSGAKNFLACPFYWDTLANAGSGTVDIHCSVIGEAASGTD